MATRLTDRHLYSFMTLFFLPPDNPEIWKKFAAYSHVDLDALRFGHSKVATSHQELLSSNPATETVQYRKVPLLAWSKIDKLTRLSGGPVEKLAHAMIETDVSGPRVYALRVKNDAMEPLFHQGGIIFVSPDLPPMTITMWSF
ncbi:MAG: hypothetical protein ABIU05_09585 [Nitrospirales bacterium]